jgi:hypothetical protein
MAVPSSWVYNRSSVRSAKTNSNQSALPRNEYTRLCACIHPWGVCYDAKLGGWPPVL